MSAETTRRKSVLLHEMADVAAGTHTLTGKQLSRRAEEIQAEVAELERREQFRRKFADAGDSIPDPTFRTKQIGKRWNPPTPMHATDQQWRNMWAAAKSRMPSYSFEIGNKELGDGISFKDAISEGSPGSLLPSVIHPEWALMLPYEPDRLRDHFRGAGMESQSVAYLAHTGNSQPAVAGVAELAEKLDIGMQLTQRTAFAIKIAALAKCSTEALADYQSFAQWVPAELTRAMVDAETDWVANDTTTGLLHNANVLTRNATTSETELDAIRYAINDLRVGPAFAQADIIAWHPTTAAYAKTRKDSLGRYLLTPDPQTGAVNSVWNLKSVENTKIAEGTALVIDTSQAVLAWTRQSLTVDMNPYGGDAWAHNYVTFRAESRQALGITRPKAICVVTGLTDSGS